MRIAICDDDQRERQKIRAYLLEAEPFEEKWELLEYADGAELVDACLRQNVRFDLIYLDIQMANMDGLETARRIRQGDEKVIIIFVTTFLDYQVRVMRYGAFNYICKPYKREAIVQSVTEAQAFMTAKREKTIHVKTRETDLIIPLYKILFIQLEKGKLLGYHLTTGEIITEYRKIAEMALRLESLYFIQIARDTLVNAEQIRKLDHKDKRIELMNGESLLANKRRWKEIQEGFLRYLGAD